MKTQDPGEPRPQTEQKRCEECLHPVHVGRCTAIDEVDHMGSDNLDVSLDLVPCNCIGPVARTEQKCRLLVECSDDDAITLSLSLSESIRRGKVVVTQLHPVTMEQLVEAFRDEYYKPNGWIMQGERPHLIERGLRAVLKLVGVEVD